MIFLIKNTKKATFFRQQNKAEFFLPYVKILLHHCLYIYAFDINEKLSLIKSLTNSLASFFIEARWQLSK